jgi:hypothetical protein
MERTRFDPNELIITDDYIEVVLYDNNMQENYRTRVSTNKLDVVKAHKWYARVTEDNVYVVTKIKGQSRQMARLLLGIEDPDIDVDHIDGDGLNNLDNNLRPCTHQQNSFNTNGHKSRGSSHRGVYKDPYSNRFRALIGVNGKTKNLGRFDTEAEAIEARRKAELRYFGEYTRK